MRDYTADKYIKLVEEWPDPDFQDWQKAELDIITGVQYAKSKTFIDLGAGYGRLTPKIAGIARNVISIEINPGMLGELKRRSAAYENTVVVQGDMQELSKLLENQGAKNPVLLLPQNTLGTIEGIYKKVLSAMKDVAVQYKGELIISLLKQEALRNFGVRLYTHIQEMTGEPDLEKTDFEGGLFVSKTGYTSKWWTPAERREVKDYFNGAIVNEIETPISYIFHTSLA